ncbi:MFS general substrate transporter, partial [Mollisia scopiformis]
YSIFNRKERLLLVFLGTFAAFLSPLTANVYYPAIVELSHEFHVSTDLINLTITVYLILQGLAPTFIGSISDVIGRRPAYMICFMVYFAANVGLALQNSFAGLMVLRCIQSAGSSGTLTLANALVADLATSSERGSYMGYATLGAFFGQAVGPLIGGLLNAALGWRSIFWFLVIFSATVFLIFIIVVPETCRAVVGNGSIPPQKWNISVLGYLTGRRFLQPNPSIPVPESPRAPRRPINLLGTVQIMFSKGAGCILLYTGFLFGGFYTQIAMVPVNFTEHFGFNSRQIGLCYLPFGLGCMAAALATGKAMDWNFQRIAKKLNYPIVPGQQNDLSKFPIEMARIQIVIPLAFLGCVTVVMYGWMFHLTKSLAAPLVLLFFLGFSLIGAFTAFSTLLVDFYPDSPGTATAAANLLRCWMGAGAVAFIGPLQAKIGSGFACVAVAICWILSSPLLWIVWKHGPAWREERRIKAE